MKILMHSYTYRGYSLERALRKSKEFGYDGIELSLVHFNWQAMESALPAALEVARQANVAVPVIDFHAPVMGDAQEVADSVAKMKKLIQIAADEGAVMLNGTVGNLLGPDPNNWGGNGSAAAQESHFAQAAEAYREIAAAAQAAGLKIAFEVHMNTLTDTAKSTQKLLDMIGNPVVVANPDPGNMFGTPHAEDVVEGVRLLGEKIGYFHMKNGRHINGRPDYSWTLETGALDYFRILSAVKDIKFQGYAAIEYCGAGDPSVAAQADVRYVRTCLEELA